MAKPKLAKRSLTEFVVFGPFDFTLVNGSDAICPKKSRKAIQAAISRRYPESALDEKAGCYIFAKRTGGRSARGGAFKPWYVGKSVGKKSKKQGYSVRPLLIEATRPDIVARHYNQVSGKHGTPCLFFIAKPGPGMTQSIGDPMIGSMESELIEWAKHENDELLNVQKVPRLKFQIVGVPLTGQKSHDMRRGGTEAKILRKMLGITGS